MLAKYKIAILIIVAIAGLIFFLLIPKIFLNEQEPIDPNDLTGAFDASKKEAVFHNEKFAVPGPLAEGDATRSVLGYESGEKRIEVDLTNQRVYAYEGDKKVYDFLISSGKWALTPTGEFTIWGKFRYTLMTGGSKALGTYYYLPNVPFVMFFYNEDVAKSRGYSLHGTYWHHNFGHPMSHGCINMKTEDAETLFYWANPELKENTWSVLASERDPGTKVIIYGETPKE